MAFTGSLIKRQEHGKDTGNLPGNLLLKSCRWRDFLFYIYAMQQCLFCGHMITLVHVHGHYQCPVCNTNALPCCDGDNCETNQLFSTNFTDPSKIISPSSKEKKE